MNSEFPPDTLRLACGPHRSGHRRHLATLEIQRTVRPELVIQQRRPPENKLWPESVI